MQVVALSSVSDGECFDYVEITGPDALTFLQGQVTCNMQRLNASQSLVGAICNLKGRVIADFRLFQSADDTILLQTGQGMGQKIVATLNRYAVFSRVQLQAAPGPVTVQGLIGATTAEALEPLFPVLPAADHEVLHTGDHSLIRLPGPAPRWQLHCHSQVAVTALAPLLTTAVTGQPEDWLRQDILAGIVHIKPDSSEQYTPQLLNYDRSGVIDFAKGCYTGQEVVARMYYRSKAKKRMYRLRSKQPLSGAESAAAEILCAVEPARADQQDSLALAIVSTELAASGDRLHLGSGTTLVHIEEINYSPE